jgi:hypothetical protein
MTDCSSKEEVAAYMKAWRIANREKRRADGRAYYLANREKWLSPEMNRKAAARLKANPESARRAVKTYALKFPERKRAHWAFKEAVRQGKIVRPSICPKCGNEGRIHAHHHDYTKPLEVEFLCSSCHGKQHRMEIKTCQMT